MVVRDSIKDFILVTVWGSEQYIDELIDSIRINSCGIKINDIKHELIIQKKIIFLMIYSYDQRSAR